MERQRAAPVLALFFLSAASLLFEIDLSRLLSVAQFYHFAFMVVSLALLGYGISGTVMAIFPALVQKFSHRSLAWISLACGASILGAYLLINLLPFDSFSIAWDRRQALVLALHYLALSLPFTFSGLAAGLLLAVAPAVAGRTYAANLLGSAGGCLLVLAAGRLGGEGLVILSSGLAFAAALIAMLGSGSLPAPSVRRRQGAYKIVLLFCLIGVGLCFGAVDLGQRLTGQGGFQLLELRLSPYKSLSYLLQQPGTRVTDRQWNAYSRVDVLSSPGIHSFPGLSYRYLQPLPVQGGLLVDGDDLSPILSADASLEFGAYLPGALAYRLRPGGSALVLGGRGGAEVALALASGAKTVTAVEANPLVSAAVPLYADPRVRLVQMDERSYLRSSRERFDVIVFSLNAAFHPIRSGAYSLAEDYRYTVESFVDALSRLAPDGILVFSRWLQNPPSEDLRALAVAAAALEELGMGPGERIVALRGYQLATFLVSAQPFQAGELALAGEFTGERAFDLSYAPGIAAGETNRYNILPESVYYQAYQALLSAASKPAFYRGYPYEVSPPTDDKPFFGHFFKWSQAGQVLSELGRTWQPFGGAGYFVILALLILATGLAGLLILLPALLARWRDAPGASGPAGSKSAGAYLLYFGLIGLAFMLVEVPLIQKFILYLGQPAYALAAILFTLLLFSGIGSWQVKRISLGWGLACLALLLFALPFLLPHLFRLTLGGPLWLRLLLTVLVLAPVGFLMGTALPGGIGRLEKSGLAAYVPWSWAVNGSASVVSALLAALLALTFGFNWVLRLGALCYAGALLVMLLHRHGAGVAAPDIPSPVNGTNETIPKL